MPTAKIETLVSNNELQSFLKNHRAVDVFTHTSIGNPKGSYNIINSNVAEFMGKYTKVVFEEKIPTHLTEGIRDCEYTPLKIDIDFRYYNNELVRTYSLEDIVKICQIYMECLEIYLESPDDSEREFFILEKPQPTYDKDKNGNFKEKDGMKRIKDGVHIMAPRIVTNNNLQLKVREYVIKKCGEILDKYNFENSYAEIFDRAVIDRNNWQMYGSCKPGQPPYLVTKIYRIWKDKSELVLNTYSNPDLVKLLSVRNKFEYSLIKPEKENDVFNEGVENIKKKLRNDNKKGKKNVIHIDPKDIALVCQYVDCLSPTRANNYKQWMELGWCLHNIHNKDNALLTKWIEFSKKSPQYSHTAEEECTELWAVMADDGGLGIGSLKLWARKDNFELYCKIVQNDIADSILKTCSTSKGTPYDTARVLHSMYKDHFICVSIKDNVWYWYSEEDHRWMRDDKGITLRRKISTDVYQEFNKLQQYKSSQSLEAGDKAGLDAQKILNVMMRLKDTAFKNNVMTEAAEIFYDKDRKFLESLDSTNHIIGFKNGVYDLNKEEYRPGRPEDYISLNTKINYIPYDPESEDVKEIYNMYKSIFVIKKVREYVFKRTSSFLSGSTKDELFDVYSGAGGNGKSKHIELVEAALGEYATKLPITLLTQKRGAAGNATPELAKTKGMRLCTLQEPDTKTKINVGLMKEVTGGDKIQARALYSEPFEFKPQFKLVLCCNDKPELPEHDDGTWRRLRNTEFISKFVHEPHWDRPLHFKIRTELSDKFETWAEPFMSILIHWHKIYRKEGIGSQNTPDEIMEYTNEYRATNNHFRDFVNDAIDYEPASSVPVRIEDIYETYKSWYKQNNNDNRAKNRKELKAYLDQLLGQQMPANSKNNNGYKGIRIKDNFAVLSNKTNNTSPSLDDDVMQPETDELDNQV
jgi:P4 family phage/plasmid primase-like protien